MNCVVCLTAVEQLSLYSLSTLSPGLFSFYPSVFQLLALAGACWPVPIENLFPFRFSPAAAAAAVPCWPVIGIRYADNADTPRRHRSHIEENSRVNRYQIPMESSSIHLALFLFRRNTNAEQ